MQTTCSNCGNTLTPEQIALALDDAGLTADDAGLTTTDDDNDNVTFCCSSYTDERGCQGNDPALMAYWYTR